jgi:osmotically-inducible protein OsmY
MTTANLSRADVRLRDAITRQLDWDPEVDASAIGVAAAGGTVTLTGYIDTYAGKLAAERAAKRVQGVRAVANELEVRLRLERTDVDVANDVLQALDLHSSVPDNIQAAVHNGHVTLTGTVNWLFQKEDAERAVRAIRGVRGVFNHVAVAPVTGVRDVQRRITTALHDSADVDAHRISVAVDDDTAVLTGTVSTWLQREAAERAAAKAPGIARVQNRIVVEPQADYVVDED